MSKRESSKSSRSQKNKPSPSRSAPPAPPIDSPPAHRPHPTGLLDPSLLIPLYVLMIVIGYTIFLHRGVTTIAGNELSPARSLFFSTNAATLTGFQTPVAVSDYTPAGQMLVLLLMLMGILFSFLAMAPAVARLARMRYTDRQICQWAFGTTAAVLIVGGILVLLSGSGTHPFDAIFQAIAAFGNCGLHSARLPPTINSLQTQLVLLPLAILGGLGLPVLMELLHRCRGIAPLSRYSWTVLTWTAGIYIASTLLLLLLRLPDDPTSMQQWQHALTTASTTAINARSAGIPFEGFVPSMPRTVQWIAIALMTIGAAHASTGGGMKITTPATIFTGIRDSLAQRPISRLFGLTAIWMVAYLAMLSTALLVLLWTEPGIAGDQLFFLAASALGNVGLSHNPVTVSDAGLYTLSATMLAGRIMPVVYLFILSTGGTPPESKDLVRTRLTI